MPSSIASLTLTFGLVAIPVQLLSATRSHRVAFRQVHVADGGRVRNTKICEVDGAKLDLYDIGRAYETHDKQLVEVTDDELDRLPLPTARTIEIGGFLDLDTVPGQMFDKPYYLAPATPAANKPYVLMREALARAGKAAVGKYALRGSENLGLIHARGDVLVLHRLRWPDEIRAAGDAAPAAGVDLTADEVQAALDYIDATGDVDMAGMRDGYVEAVRVMLDAKAEHKRPPKPKPAAAPDGGVSDLMTALQAAADQARARRREDEAHRTPARKATKRAAKKTPAKKAAKKTARKRPG